MECLPSFLKRDIKVGILIGIYITLSSILYYFAKYIILLCQVYYITLTLTDFTLHFSCSFTKLLHSSFIPLQKRFTLLFRMAELHIIFISANSIFRNICINCNSIVSYCLFVTLPLLPGCHHPIAHVRALVVK